MIGRGERDDDDDDDDNDDDEEEEVEASSYGDTQHRRRKPSRWRRNQPRRRGGEYVSRRRFFAEEVFDIPPPPIPVQNTQPPLELEPDPVNVNPNAVTTTTTTNATITTTANDDFERGEEDDDYEEEEEIDFPSELSDEEEEEEEEEEEDQQCVGCMERPKYIGSNLSESAFIEIDRIMNQGILIGKKKNAAREASEYYERYIVKPLRRTSPEKTIRSWSPESLLRHYKENHLRNPDYENYRKLRMFPRILRALERDAVFTRNDGEYERAPNGKRRRKRVKHANLPVIKTMMDVLSKEQALQQRIRKNMKRGGRRPSLVKDVLGNDSCINISIHSNKRGRKRRRTRGC
ncbi:MAG: hypothetical protein ACTSUE_04175 [Promethearchaeota archaeon]